MTKQQQFSFVHLLSVVPNVTVFFRISHLLQTSSPMAPVPSNSPVSPEEGWPSPWTYSANTARMKDTAQARSFQLFFPSANLDSSDYWH